MKRLEWSMVGEVTELRALEAGEPRKVFAYMAKVETVGGTYEVQTRDEALYRALSVGRVFSFVGGVDSFKGLLRLALKSATPAKVAA